MPSIVRLRQLFCLPSGTGVFSLKWPREYRFQKTVIPSLKWSLLYWSRGAEPQMTPASRSCDAELQVTLASWNGGAEPQVKPALLKPCCRASGEACLMKPASFPRRSGRAVPLGTLDLKPSFFWRPGIIRAPHLFCSPFGATVPTCWWPGNITLLICFKQWSRGAWASWMYPIQISSDRMTPYWYSIMWHKSVSTVLWKDSPRKCIFVMNPHHANKQSKK